MVDHLGNDRLPDVRRQVICNRLTPRRARGARAAVVWIAAALVLMSGCAPVNLPSPAPRSATEPSAARSPLVMASPASTAEATDGTESPAPIEVDPAAFTQVCEAWGPNRPDDALRCGPAIEAALISLASDVTAIDRVDFRYTPLCADPANCPARHPRRGWVIVRSGTANIAVAVSAGGSDLEVGPTTLAPPPGPPPSFLPPVARRGPIEGRQPAEVRERAPFAFCGLEAAGAESRFDATIRHCFLNGVLSGHDVEFVSVGAGTEGEQTLALYRYAGQGGVVGYDRDAGRWTRSTCGIAPQSTDVVFLLDGLCRRQELAS